jgi:hypothetical protein
LHGGGMNLFLVVEDPGEADGTYSDLSFER